MSLSLLGLETGSFTVPMHALLAAAPLAGRPYAQFDFLVFKKSKKILTNFNKKWY